MLCVFGLQCNKQVNECPVARCGGRTRYYRPNAAAKGILVCNSVDVFAFANQKTMQYQYPKDDMYVYSYPSCV